ncbi:MAG TPA: hypothetical protein VEH27_14695 [Methylomirabilota bacterium]|nr:hypothetical protein [Methylomirabilota bacterium]
MRYTVGLVLALSLGFAAGWFTGGRRMQQSHAAIGLGEALPLYRDLLTNNIAEARAQVESQIESLVIEAWGSGLLRKNTNYIRNVRAVSTNFADHEIKARVEQWLNEAYP